MKKPIIIALIAVAALSCKKDNKSKASFKTGKDSYYLTENINFTNTSQQSTTVKWDFGDNTTSTDQNPVHSYQNAGTYNVALTENGATFNKSIVVHPGTASYQVQNSTTASFDMVSYYYDGTNVVDLIDHGIMSPNQKSDTVYTSHDRIGLGGELNSKTFLVSTPYTIQKYSNNILTISGSTLIITGSESTNKASGIKALQLNHTSGTAINTFIR